MVERTREHESRGGWRHESDVAKTCISACKRLTRHHSAAACAAAASELGTSSMRNAEQRVEGRMAVAARMGYAFANRRVQISRALN